jgi:class 3 adenylate cyclase
MENSVENLFQSFNGLSEVMTSFALFASAPWPEFTLPDFEEHAGHLIGSTPVEVIWTAPIVPTGERASWERYSVQQSSVFISPRIYEIVDDEFTPATGPGPYVPIWQQTPTASSLVNYNQLSDPSFVHTFDAVSALEMAVISKVYTVQEYIANSGLEEEEDKGKPHSTFVEPVFDSFGDSKQIVSYMQARMSWEEAFSGVIPGSKEGDLHVVLKNTCNQTYTWAVGGGRAIFLGEGDLHEEQYDDFGITADITPFYNVTAAQEAGVCLFSFDAYPTSSLRDTYRSSKPQTYTGVVAAIFVLMALTFLMYDRFIQKRNEKVVNAAARSNAIVSALFPSNVRDRLFAEAKEEEEKGNRWLSTKSGLKNFLTEGEAKTDDDMMFKSKPIADLFPETSIMFADLVGFTAWSSVREPSQVFTLLETVYHAFDMIAKQRRIFKVETVGDCYVAVAGLPEPRKDHAVAMVKFAHECLRKLGELTKRLEVELGPDTGDLTVRVGIHSGPVTAGVLRGERSRFQLFGDTMNTAARMESTGMKDKIQISQETADLLYASGKNHWVKPRADIVEAKGKGRMQTYWVDIVKRSDGRSTVSSDESRTSYDDTATYTAANVDESELMGDDKVQRLMSDKTNRLIDWNCDVLIRLLKQIVAARDAAGEKVEGAPPLLLEGNVEQTCLEEVIEIITLPEFDAKVLRKQRDPEEIELGINVEQQVHDYVSNIAVM